jgi:hypothetical protein
MPLLGRGRLLEELGVDVRGRRGDAFLDGEPGLELGIDHALERNGGELLPGLVERIDLRLAVGLGNLAGHDGRADPAFGFVDAP